MILDFPTCAIQYVKLKIIRIIEKLKFIKLNILKLNILKITSHTIFFSTKKLKVIEIFLCKVQVKIDVQHAT